MKDSDDDAVQETWETGLRQRRRRQRRRGQSSSNNVDGDDGDDDDAHEEESPPPMQESGSEYDRLRRRSNDHDDTDDIIVGNNTIIVDRNSTDFIGGGGGGGGAVIGIGVSGPSYGNGNSTAAVSVGMQSGPAIGGAICNALGLGGGGGGGTTSHHHHHQFTTPLKAPPMKDTNGGGAGLLVAATPSSITTAGETADSTYLSQSPINVRRRHSRRRSSSNNNASASAPSLHRQYQLLRSQMILLLGSSALGLILFLFYALPLIAFMSLVLMVSSMGALLPVAISFVRARYEMEMEHPLGLVRYLPDSLRIFLTETTLHEFMADTTLFMETRYLLMYFMPGLSPEQLMEYIHRLPPRHRDALLQPGLGRLMPSVMENLMRMDDASIHLRGQYDLDNPDTLLHGTNNGDDASSASGLTVERERQGGGDNFGDANVTFLEAVISLRRTLSSFASRNTAAANTNNFDLPLRPDQMRQGGDDVVMLRPLPQLANGIAQNEDTPVDNQAAEDDDDDDNSSFDFSVDLNAHGLTNMLSRQGVDDEPPTLPLVAAAASSTNITDLRNVIVELPLSSTLDSSEGNIQNNEEIRLQREYDLEGRILSEAASAAIANYTAQASVAARVAASDVVASSSSWIIRAGVFTGVIAGGGGIVATVLSRRHFGEPSRTASTFTTSSSEGLGGGNRFVSDSTPERRSGYDLTLYGLFATSALGFASAGFAYLVRNRARAVIAANREVQCLEEAAPEKEGDKHDP